MHSLKTTTIVSAALVSLLVSACGGDGSGVANNQRSSTSSSVSSGSVDTTTAQKLGSGTGENFNNGVIGVSNNITELSAGGTTTLEVYVVSSTNTPVATATTINFISSCIAANKAILKNSAGEIASSTTTINGRATMTYTANGCVGADRVTASAGINNATTYANVDLEIEPGTVGSIQFDSATPASIGLKGSGGIETSVVQFRVLDGNGAPIENTPVTFTMSTTAGGLSMSPATDLSDSDGYVSTTINAGTVPTDVSVTATVDSSSISTTSRVLRVATGVPVQRSASLSATKFNPRSWDRDGEEVDVTMRMADDFGNPVVDGTTVTFWTEGGAIEPNCTTVNGTCSVTWKSQEERPTNGRVTVLAFTSGNESFVDKNTNGQYDAGEIFTDMGEAFRDDNESYEEDLFEGVPGIDAGYDLDELFVNLDGGNPDQRDSGNGAYSGTLCKSDVITVCSKEKVTVRRSLVLSMSAPYGVFSLFSDPTCTTPAINGLLVGDRVYVMVSDINGNSLPSGAEVGIGDPKDSDVFTVVPNSSNPICYGVPVPISGTSLQVFSRTLEDEFSTYVINN